MFEFTNGQRQCFALPFVEENWDKVTVEPSSYDNFISFAYIEDCHICKLILYSDNADKAKYSEFQVDADLSDDKEMFLPKTAKGKAKPFTSSNLLKYTKIGMSLSYSGESLSVINYATEQDFYNSSYEDLMRQSLLKMILCLLDTSAASIKTYM